MRVRRCVGCLAVLIGIVCAPVGAQVNDYESALKDLHATLGWKYCCFKLKNIDWDAVGKELLPRVKDVNSDEAFGLLCMQMVARLEDSHAILRQGRAPVPNAPLPMWDAGFACMIDDQDRLVVFWVDGNGPAGQAKLAVGSVVISLNGKPAAEALAEVEKLLKTWYGFSSDRVLQYDAARMLAHQMKNGDAVKLEVEDPASGAKRSVELKATVQTQYIPRLPVPIAGIGDSDSVSFTKLADDIGYLRVRRIQGQTIGPAIDDALKGLGDVKGLIIDVRGNSGGGFDDSALRNFNLEDGSEPLRPRYTGPIAMLIDERCISAGEGWASWFVAKKRAKLFGTATAGASSRKETYTLKNGLYRVVIPVKAYAGSLDRPIEGRGLEPDVAVRSSAKDLAMGRDTVLEAARKDLVEQARVK